MARTTGPLFGLDAAGGLAGIMSYSAVKGGRVAKRTPHRKTAPSRRDRATRAAMQFAQRTWTPVIIANATNTDWKELAARKNVPNYNAFISDALSRLRAGVGPRISPTRSFGPTTGDIASITPQLFKNGVTFTGTITTENDIWGVGFYVVPDFSTPTTIADLMTTYDFQITGDDNITSHPVTGLQSGSTWFVATRTWSLDGNISLETEWLTPFTIP